MPSREVSFEKACQSLSQEQDTSSNGLGSIVSTPLGLALLEIQGELNLPQVKPEGLNAEEESLYADFQISKYINNENDGTTAELIKQAVKFGRLESNPDDPKKLTLFISKSQRLLGSIEKLDPPLGVLKISNPKDSDASERGDHDGSETQGAEIIDVIKQKIVFRFRPLPIM